MDCPVRKEVTTVRHHELISVRQYVQNDSVCRRKWLLDYFNFQLKEVNSHCCDVCSITEQCVMIYFNEQVGF